MVLGSKLFSLLDGFSGYNQVLVAEEDTLKTTFRTKWGTFAYRRMPFGLINAGATFQRDMDIAFCGLIGRIIVVYLDDITIFSKKREEHAFHLKHIFKHCRKYGISLNPKKCVFAVTEGKLLGHMVSKKGISLDPERIKAIEQIPLPHNKKGMQSFMGTINFVRRLASNFAQIVKPLQQMVKQSVQFKWIDSENGAFNKIKTSIAHAPSLKSPNFEKDFILYTFALDDSLAVVLT